MYLSYGNYETLTLEGKILIFKTLALSKIIFQAFVTSIPIYIVTELEKIQESFLWKNSTSKIRHDTLCNDYKDGRLKNVDVRKKLSKTFGKSFIFHANLSFKKKLIKSFQFFYKEILLNWKTFFLRH